MQADGFETEEIVPGDAEWRCQECTILIGEAYQEKLPFRSPLDGHAIVCWRCYESLQRRKERPSERPSRAST